MSETEESHRIPAQQAAGPDPAHDKVITNSDSTRSGPKGSKTLTLLLSSMALVIVAFALLYFFRAG